jgi:hypothetical protein
VQEWRFFSSINISSTETLIYNLLHRHLLKFHSKKTIIKARIILLELAVTNPAPIFFTGAKTTNYTCSAMVLPTTTVTEHSRGKPKLGPPSQQCKTPQVRFLQHTHEGATRRHQEWLMLLHR